MHAKHHVEIHKLPKSRGCEYFPQVSAAEQASPAASQLSHLQT